MIRIGAVNYTNTYPLLHKLEDLHRDFVVEISSEIPARLADKLLSEEIDLALLPVAVIPLLETYHLVGDYGIGSENKVASVALFADRPVEELSSVYLDYHSRSSAALLRWLAENVWDVRPQWLSTQDDSYFDQIGEDRGGLVIGDRAFDLLDTHPFVYDLAENWRAHTGLPFVFARWVSLRELDAEFLRRFDALQAEGVAHIPDVIADHGLQNHPYDMQRYYTQNISYKLDARYDEAMRRFLEGMKAL